VNDLDTAALVRAAREMNEGRDLAGHPLEGASNFCVGVLTTLDLDSEAKGMDTLKKAIAEGAQFIKTQPVYQPDVLERFMEAVSQFKLPVIIGHVLLKSASMASFLNSNVPDVFVPQDVIDRLEGLPREDLIKASHDLAVELIRKMKPLCQGVHFIPMGWERYIPDIVGEID
jgi:5,10-methylenetetrahydrofolate reductase